MELLSVRVVWGGWIDSVVFLASDVGEFSDYDLNIIYHLLGCKWVDNLD